MLSVVMKYQEEIHSLHISTAQIPQLEVVSRAWLCKFGIPLMFVASILLLETRLLTSV